MKLFKRALFEIFVISSIVVCSFTFINKDNNKDVTPLLTTTTQTVEQVAKEQEKMDVAIDIKKEILDEKLTRAEAMVSRTSEDLELVLLTLDGSINTTHARKTEDDFVFFNQANLNVKLDFTCKIGISTNNIKFEVLNDGTIGIDYNKDDIKILSTQINNATYSEHADIFSKKFSKSELISIIEGNTDKIKTAVENNDKYINKAEKVLQSYYCEMGKTCGVYGICLNGKTTIINKTYNFFDYTNVAYGHNNSPLKQEDVKYIIVHGTGNPNVDAKSHIKWLNDDSASDQNACHFFVDPSGIYQALQTNIISWNAGKEYNDKSVSVEICTYDNNTKQMQAIQNARTVVNILKRKYPNARVVTHKEVSDWSKPCPSFIYGDNPIMTEDEFLNIFKN